MNKKFLEKVHTLFKVCSQAINLKENGILTLSLKPEFETFTCSDGSISTFHPFNKKYEFYITNNRWVDKDLDPVKVIYNWNNISDEGKWLKHDYRFTAQVETSIFSDAIPEETDKIIVESVDYFLENIDELTEYISTMCKQAKEISNRRTFGLREDSYYYELEKKQAETNSTTGTVTINADNPNISLGYLNVSAVSPQT